MTFRRVIFSIVQIIFDLSIFNLCLFAARVNLNFQIQVFLTGAVLAFFLFSSMYGFRSWSFWEETRQCMRSCLYVFSVSMLFLFAEKSRIPLFSLTLSFAMFIPFCLLVRYFFKPLLFKLGLFSKSVIILGAGDAGEILAGKIMTSPFTARKILGFFDDDDDKQGSTIAGVPVLGRLSDFERMQGELQAEEVIISIPTASREELSGILAKVEEMTEHVLYVPNMYMLTTSAAEIRSVDGMPIISSSQGLLNPVNLAAKTIIDYIGAVIATIIFSPFMIWAAYKIKKEDGGPVLFIQDRVGWKGRHFKTYKFRSMCTNADEVTQKLFSNPEILADYQKGIKLKEDPRLTKIGAVLRKTSIDELPQLFNVLKGEMSLVGPRPLMQSDADFVYGELFTKKVYAAKPGLTGIWQVSGRSDLDADFRREINCYYVHNWSVWLDVSILMKTPVAVITSKGAY